MPITNDTLWPLTAGFITGITDHGRAGQSPAPTDVSGWCPVGWPECCRAFHAGVIGISEFLFCADKFGYSGSLSNNAESFKTSIIHKLRQFKENRNNYRQYSTLDPLKHIWMPFLNTKSGKELLERFRNDRTTYLGPDFERDAGFDAWKAWLEGRDRFFQMSLFKLFRGSDCFKCHCFNCFECDCRNPLGTPEVNPAETNLNVELPPAPAAANPIHRNPVNPMNALAPVRNANQNPLLGENGNTNCASNPVLTQLLHLLQPQQPVPQQPQQQPENAQPTLFELLANMGGGPGGKGKGKGKGKGQKGKGGRATPY